MILTGAVLLLPGLCALVMTIGMSLSGVMRLSDVLGLLVVSVPLLPDFVGRLPAAEKGAALTLRRSSTRGNLAYSPAAKRISFACDSSRRKMA
jgi:hypothetical protein